MQQDLLQSLARKAVRLLARLTARGPLHRSLQKLADAYRREQLVSATGSDLPEILSVHARPDRAQGGPRLNLLVPAVSEQHVFGGIDTALQVFDALRKHFGQVRIIVTDEQQPRPRPDAYYGRWPVIPLAADPVPGDHIVAAGGRWGQSLAVHEHDYFMVTAWWTAHHGFALLDWQRAHHRAMPQRRLLYLIQDYEPGFYPWSSRYLLAQATYQQPGSTIAVVNSQLLADYLDEQGYAFAARYVLQPRLHPVLAAARRSMASFAKERVLLVYGRPGTERNAFGLILATLRLWAENYPLASRWQVLSAGETFEPVDIGLGCKLRSLGKLSLDDYARLLSRTAVGFSLMVSPHPSYPPLEMAAFGAQVLSNRFANKDLARISPQLHTIQSASPPALSNALIELTRQFDRCAEGSVVLQAREIAWQGSFLDSASDKFPWADDAVAALLAS